MLAEIEYDGGYWVRLVFGVVTLGVSDLLWLGCLAPACGIYTKLFRRLDYTRNAQIEYTLVGIYVLLAAAMSAFVKTSGAAEAIAVSLMASVWVFGTFNLTLGALVKHRVVTGVADVLYGVVSYMLVFLVQFVVSKYI